MVEIKLTHAHLLFSDGVNLRFHQPGESVPLKQQLLLTFTDGSALSASVQMYGGLSCWVDGDIFLITPITWLPRKNHPRLTTRTLMKLISSRS